METKGYGEVTAPGPHRASHRQEGVTQGGFPVLCPPRRVGTGVGKGLGHHPRASPSAGGEPKPTCCWSLFGKGRHQNFGWRKHSLLWVLSNANISPLPEACFLYITQQVSPLPDYSFKGHLKPLLFIHYLNVFSSQQPPSPAPRLEHPAMSLLSLAPSPEM